MKQALRILLPGCAVLTVVIIALYRFQTPYWNWDMLPYMAGAVEMDGGDPAACHTQAYADAALHVPRPLYDQLIDSNSDYRRAMYADGTAFADQMPFYWVKPLYIASVWAAWKCGATLARATLWPSFLGFLLVCLALFTLSRREVSSEVAAVVVVLFAALPCVNEMAGLSTPDALGACLLLFAIVQLSRPISSVRGILLLSLAIGVRADNGIMAGLLLLAQPWYAPSRKLPRKSLVIGMLTLVVIYLIVDRIACAHGWCVRPAYSFLPHTLHPGAVHVDMTMERYIAAMRKGFDSLTYTWVVEFSVLATFGLFTTMIRRDRTFNSNHRLLAVITLAVIIRYLLFPIPDDRALIPWYVAITLIMVPEILSAYELIASMIAKPRKSLPNPTTP